MKILVDKMPEKAWECLFCNTYDLTPSVYFQEPRALSVSLIG